MCIPSVLPGDALATRPDRQDRPHAQASPSGLLAFFDHRITSAGAKGLNSRIQAIRISHAARNRANFKTAIYSHCGGLDLSNA